MIRIVQFHNLGELDVLLNSKLLESKTSFLLPTIPCRRMEFQKKLIPWREALILLAIFHVPLIAQSRPNYIDSFTHSIQSYEKIWVNVGGKLALCTGNEKGNIVLEVGGGKPPYSFRWNTNETTQNRANLNAGTYTVWITDSEGSIHREAIVIQPPFPLILNPLVKKDASCGSANNGYAKIGVKIGRNDYEKDIPPYKVTWSNGLKDVWEANNLAPGTYTVKVADTIVKQASLLK